MQVQDSETAGFKSVLKKFAALPTDSPIPVRILGSVTVDCITTERRTDAKVREPELGGSAFRILDAWHRIEKAKKGKSGSGAKKFNLRVYAKCPSPSDVADGWNAVFDKLRHESGYSDELQLSSVEGLRIPVSMHVLKPDGTRDRYQQDHPDLQLSWKDESMKDLLDEKGPGILYIGGVWRSQLHEGLVGHLKTLRDKGWIIALHPGAFGSSNETFLKSLREALGMIDVLFASPLSLVLLGATKTMDVRLLRQQCSSALDYVATGQLRIGNRPPIIVLHHGFFSLEVLISDPETIIRLPSPLAAGKPIYGPVGLRSAFIAAFLHALCDQQIGPKQADDAAGVALLQASLSRAVADAFHLTTDLAVSASAVPIPIPASVTGANDIISNSPAMLEVMRKIRQVAGSKSTVLLTGETGTGKTHLAKAIHQLSGRKREFVKVDLARMNSDLVNSELFGHEKGAFTGATKKSPGLFRTADKGTLFLDEIGRMPNDAQQHLLVFLDDKHIKPVGATEPVPVDVRIVAATNKDLHQATRQREFLEELYYRIKVVTITIPPLRERPEDVGPLAEHFLVEKAAEEGKELTDQEAGRLLATGALEELQKHDWPGNVREVRNVMEALVALCGLDEPFSESDVNRILRQDANERTEEGASASTEVTQNEKRILREIVEKIQGKFRGGEESLFRLLIETPELEMIPGDVQRRGLLTRSRFYNCFRKKGVLKSNERDGAAVRWLATEWLKSIIRKALQGQS